MASTNHEGYVKLQAWVPNELWEELKAEGITSPTSALNQGLQLLLETTKGDAQNYHDTTADKARLEENEKLIETLKADLNQAHQDKEALQNLYDNYMRQMQTLIQQKALEAPGEKKKWWKIWK